MRGAVLHLDRHHGLIIERLDPGGMLGRGFEERIDHAVGRGSAAFRNDFLHPSRPNSSPFRLRASRMPSLKNTNISPGFILKRNSS